MTKNSIMRKLFSITMCAILVLSLSACGSKEENVNTDTINNVVRVIIETLKGGN